MKKPFTKFIASLTACLTVFLILGCASSRYDGTYRDYFIKEEKISQYYSMVLKGGRYTLSEVKVLMSDTTTKVLSNGSFEIDDEGAITFTESGGKTFSGTISDDYLEFSRNGIIYSMPKY